VTGAGRSGGPAPGRSWRAALLLAAALALAGCNTVAGIGEDITGGAERVGAWF
jgi:predicted small secreted protein